MPEWDLAKKEMNWNDVRGKHGVGRMNEASLFLLSFCSTMNLTIMNTYFEKRDIY